VESRLVAETQSSGKTPNTPNKNAAPQASRRSATLGVLEERLKCGRPCTRDQLQAGFLFGVEAEQVAMSIPRDHKAAIAANIVSIEYRRSAKQRSGRLRRSAITGFGRGSSKRNRGRLALMAALHLVAELLALVQISNSL